MSAELDALLDAIRANPEDDLPRLALADWCLEQADPATQARGEFIHCRCRAAALPVDDPARGRLELRARELRQAHEIDWLGGLDSVVPGWDFERGCVLIEVNRQSLRKYPLTKLATRPGARWVIGVRGVLLEADDVRRIVRSPLTRLTSLDFRDSAVGVTGARILAGSSQVRHLAALHLDYCGLGHEGTILLAASAHLRRLTTLSLCNNDISARAGIALMTAEYLGQLIRLDLSRNPIGEEAVRVLLSSSKLTSLRELSLASCRLPDRIGMLFASASRFDALTLFNVSDNAFRPGTIEELRERFGERLRA